MINFPVAGESPLSLQSQTTEVFLWISSGQGMAGNAFFNPASDL
ncbi:MAG TPA: hypothetical protein PLB32_25585 [Acidobacteriota bacterium]|nr:hypothetical protein [Acidobacteriota bacterium]